MSIGKFLDFDRNERVVFYNIFLNKYKLTIKIPIFDEHLEKDARDFKIEHFDLVKYTFLLNCDV